MQEKTVAVVAANPGRHSPERHAVVGLDTRSGAKDRYFCAIIPAANATNAGYGSHRPLVNDLSIDSVVTRLRESDMPEEIYIADDAFPALEPLFLAPAVPFRLAGQPTEAAA